MRLSRPRPHAARPDRRPHAKTQPPAPAPDRAPAPAPDEPELAAPAEPALAAERRLRAAGGPDDRATYACRCGAVFPAAPTTSVSCPLCGIHQAW
ncbi:MAG: hypothetical protein M3417_03430 [Actinomycetota bacterium]|nr:hypothetical protein [Actinomycetota bacterium]